MTENTEISFEEFKEEIISSVEESISDSENSVAKLIFYEEMLEYNNGLSTLWDDDPRQFYDDRILAGNHSEDWKYLDIIIATYRGKNDLISGYTSEKILKREFIGAENLVLRALDGDYRDIEESNELRDFLKEISENRGHIQRIRYFLITDYPCITDSLPNGNEKNKIIEYHILNLENTYRNYVESHSERCIDIDLMDDFGEKIPCMKVGFANPDVEYISYLGYLKGGLLADLYEKYNERLLEGNIRVFLQTTVPVNKSIRSSLRSSEGKSRFFAYNNGISATAESVVVSEPDAEGIRWIEKITNLQIVNGGQTTASIHSAKKDRINIDGVYVQMKLTVPKDPAALSILNPKIAEYSNSQNQIKKADFTSNHEYHILLEKISREIPVPRKESQWFYERIRGQYNETRRLYGSQTGKKKPAISFDTKYPKSRKLTKTELALYYNAWNQFPYFAALGGEKNFVKFNSLLKNEDGEINIRPDKRYYRELIAMAILFIRTDTMVADWQKDGSKYGTGYKREIVLYTISLLSYLTEQKLNLEIIWDYQEHHGAAKKTFRLPPDIEDYISKLILIAEEHVRHPPVDRSDAREWAKTERSWISLKNQERVKHIPVPDILSQKYYMTAKQDEERKAWLKYIIISEPKEDSLSLPDSVPDEIPETSTTTEILTEETHTPDTHDNAAIQVRETNDYPAIRNILRNPGDFLEKRNGLELYSVIKYLESSRLLSSEEIKIFYHIKQHWMRRKQCSEEVLSSAAHILDYVMRETSMNPGNPDEDVFVYKTRRADGQMVIRDGKYVVLKGSIISSYQTPGMHSIPRMKIDSLLQSGGLTSTADGYLLNEDTQFETSGQAASFVAGNNSSGNECWKFNTMKLKDYLIRKV